MGYFIINHFHVILYHCIIDTTDGSYSYHQYWKELAITMNVNNIVLTLFTQVM